MDVLGGKWTPVVLSHIKQGPIRYSQLRRLIPDITEKMLTQRLRALEDDELVSRRQVATTPPHVEYELTAHGRTLEPVLQSLYDWGRLRAQERMLVIDVPKPS